MSERRSPRPGDARVVVVGDVMVDVLVEVLDARAHGSDTASSIATAPGGSAANLAVWLAGAGTHVALVAAVGADPFGEAALESLAAEGVGIAEVVEVARPTGTVVALVEPDGQRTMLTDRGANLELTGPDVERALRDLGPGDHVHVSGYCLLDDATRPAGRRALTLAADAGATRSVDASSAGPLAALGARRFLELVEGTEYLFCNEDEGAVLTGRAGADDVAAALSAWCREVVVTLGSRGAIALERGGVPERARAAASRVTDTVGAGDGVVGSYLSARLRGASVDAALDEALAAGGSTVARRGARPWSGYSRS